MSSPLKRTKSIGNLEVYFQKKLRKYRDQLTDEQIEQLRSQIKSGDFLASKLLIKAMRHKVSESKVDSAISKAVKETGSDREQVELDREFETLLPKAAEALDLAKSWVNEAPKHVDMVKGVAAQLEKLADFEFVKVSSSGSRALQSAVALRAHAQRLIDGDLRTVVKMHSRVLTARQAKDVEALRVLVTELPEAARALAPKYYELGVAGKDAVDAAIAMMDEKVVKAWVKKNPDATSKWLERGLILVGAGIDIGEEALSDSPAKAFTPILSAFKVLYTTVIKRQAMAYDAHRQVRKEQHSNVKGHGFALADEDSTLIATEVARQQKANFDTALSVIGFLAAEIPGWSIISTVVKKGAHAYYNERVKRAKAIAGQTSEKTWEEREEEATDAVLDEIAESLPGAITTAVTEGIEEAISGGFEALQDLATDLVIGRIMTELAKHLPIEPAQIVTGDQLRVAMGGLQDEVSIRRYGQSEEVEGVGRTTVECPTEDAEGRAVDRVMQAMSEQDDQGRFYWVKIGSEVGRLYVEDKSFTAVSSMGMAFPEADKDGRAIDEVLSKFTSTDKPGSTLQVRMGDLVGVYYNDGRFEPTRPASTAAWAVRQVAIDSYKEGTRTVAGTWTRCTGTRYLFFEHGGRREWAEIDNRTANRFNFAELFEHSSIQEVDIATLQPVR